MNTILYLKWKLSDRIEVFRNLGKIYKIYNKDNIGISRHTLNRKDLFKGYENEFIEIKKLYLK